MHSLKTTDSQEIISRCVCLTIIVFPNSVIEALGYLQNAANLLHALGLALYRGFRASLTAHAGISPLPDSLSSQILNSTQALCEGQCRSTHDFDLFEILHGVSGKLNRVVKVGVLLCRASVLLAGCFDSIQHDS